LEKGTGKKPSEETFTVCVEQALKESASRANAVRRVAAKIGNEKLDAS
jgi:hypothetical protein